jgi:putative inorganic carbon (HCO3(-)) transporter
MALSFAEPLLRIGRFEFAPEKVLFWAFLGLLVWAPIPLGGNRPWAWMMLEIWAFALLAAWIVLWGFGAVTIPEPLKRAWPACALLLLWLAHQALHVVPLPPEWVAVLSPESARMQSMVEDLGIKKAAMTLSIDPQASRVALLKSIAYSAVFFLTLALVNRRSRLLTLARVLVYAAVIHAIYAVMLHLGGVQDDYLGTIISHGGSASGTFANRNHFAGFLEISLALGIGLLIAGLSDRGVDTWKKFLRLTIEWILSPKMILRLSLCILVIALTTTHSRMGNTAFFSALLIAGALGIALSRFATRNTVLLLASLIAIDLLIVGSWFGVEKLAQRLEQTTVEDVREREQPAAYTLPLIKDYAVFGSGPGSFYVAFPRYRPASIANFYNHTHNDYAQFASESGISGFLIIGGFVVVSLGAALVAQWRRRDPLMRGMSFACVMGVTAILIHSWVDFNLQIPANAMLFMVLLALGWISLFHDRRENGTDARARTRIENGA